MATIAEICLPKDRGAFNWWIAENQNVAETENKSVTELLSSGGSDFHMDYDECLNERKRISPKEIRNIEKGVSTLLKIQYLLWLMKYDANLFSWEQTNLLKTY